MLDVFYKVMLVILFLTAIVPSSGIPKLNKIENAVWAIVFVLLLRLK
jgi:hypothetical protein